MISPLIIKSGPKYLCRLVFFLFFILVSGYIQAQESKKTCGVYHKPVTKSVENKSVDIIDQFGNSYDEKELNIQSFHDQYSSASNKSTVSNCTGGDFTLEFFGFTCDEEITICNVFQEISDLIDIGPNGNSPLITVAKVPFQNDDGSNDTETLGVGITFFQVDCGIANNLIYDVMYTDIFLPPGFASGVLRINSLLPFYNDVQGTVAGHYDLHTVALHEVLHILGYSSLIENGGGNASGYYSRWDTYLYSDNDMVHLIDEDANPPIGCCNSSAFNPALSYDQVITADCGMDVFFRDNGQNIARAYGVDYPADNPGGLLSHLDRCTDAGDAYVMTAELDAEEERDITQEEIDILYALGYQEDGGAEQCNVIANNDVITLVDQVESSLVIPWDQIFGNDAVRPNFLPQFHAIFHTSGCGTIESDPNIFINSNSSSGLRVYLRPCTTFDLCYTISGCDGECDDGVITIERVCPPCLPLPPLCPPADICAGENLFCHGDFEDFIPGRSDGLEPPSFNLGLPLCTSLTESPDIIYDQADDNRMLGLGAVETAIIPLSTPVQPGCTINISYRYAKSTQNMATVDFIGTSVSLCDLNQIPVCPGPNCVASVSTTLGVTVNTPNLPCDNTTPPDIDCDCIPIINTRQVNSWAMINTVPFVNNTSEAINFIQISSPTASNYYVIDDLVITADCDNVVDLTVSSSVDVCQGEEAVVDIMVCLEGTNTVAEDVIITVNFPNQIGLDIVPGSAFEGGSHTIPNTVAGSSASPNCYPVSFNLEVGYNFPIGSQIEVDFEVTVANSCSDVNSQTSSVINVVSCPIPCVLQTYPTIVESCGNDGSIDLIVAGGSGNYSYQWNGGLGTGPSIIGLAVGDYIVTVTDIADPTCATIATINVPQDPNCSNDVCDVFMIAAMCGWQPFDTYQPCDPCGPNVTHLVMLIKDPNGPIDYQGDVWRVAFMEGGIDWYYQDSNTGAIIMVPGNNGAAMEMPSFLTVNDIDHAIVDYFWEKIECKVTPTWNCPMPISTEGKVDFVVEDKGIRAGDTYRIPVTTSDFRRMSSYSFALDIDERYIQIVGLQKGDLPGFSTKNHSYENGILRAEWVDKNNRERTLNSEQVAFYITVRAREDVDRLSKHMTQIFFDENNIAANNRGDKYHVVFDFVVENDIKTDMRSTSVVSSTLISPYVSPNPFSDFTAINFYSYEEQEVTIKLVDPLGKEVLGAKMNVVVGDNTYKVSSSVLIPGLYFYQIYNGQERLTGSMIKI